MYGIAPPGFRLPDATHVGAVWLQVNDLGRSLEYYEHVLGLHVQRRTADEAALGAHGDERPLVSLRARAGIAPVPPRGAFGLYHFAILLPDRAALGQLTAHLSRFELRIGSADHRVSESLYLWDPDGLGIEVYADRPPSAWQHEGRQVVMTTEPLDVPNLIAAGGGRAWRGMPAGTDVGHMHLHVGRLDVAEAFYHRALGFDKTVWSYPGALFLSAGGYHHHLGTNTWSPGPAAAPDQAQLLEWELVVPSDEDASDAARSLRAAGYAADERADSYTVADPWGTHLRIISAQRR
jgi:catechol 2,3-dioxygenase